MKNLKNSSRFALVLLTLVVMVYMHTNVIAYTISTAYETKIVYSFASNVSSAVERAGYDSLAFETVIIEQDENSSDIVLGEYFYVTVRADNKTQTVRVTKDTVENILGDMGIIVGNADAVSPSLDTVVDKSREIIVVRSSSNTYTKTEVVPYETIYVDNISMEVGTSKVVQEGIVGENIITYETTAKNGTIILTKRVASEESIAPQEEIIEVGAKPYLTLPDGETVSYSYSITVEATAYSTEGWKNKTTATGTIARVGAIAVDPSVIPYGTKMYIVSPNGGVVYGYATAEDTGSAITGNRVDLFFDTQAECIQFGRRTMVVYILD